MPDNTAAGPPAGRRDERDGVTGGSAEGASGTPREGATRRGAPGPRPGPASGRPADDLGTAQRDTASRAPDGIVGRAGPGRRDGAPSGRDTAEYEDPAQTGEGIATPAGSGARDGVLGGRDTAGREGARGRSARESTPESRSAVERDGSPARDGIPGPAGAGIREGGPAGHGTDIDGTHGGHSGGGRLMARDEGDKWSLRLQHAVAGFVDGPRGSVEEADQVLQEVAERFADAVTQRRRTLRTSWQAAGDDKADTEQLRLALRDYRELAERLLRL